MTRKVYLITGEEMKSITDTLCQLNKDISAPYNRNKIAKLINDLARMPYVANDTAVDAAVWKIVEVMEKKNKQ